MPIQITPISQQDINGAVRCIQIAFAEDPYNRWVFNDRNRFSLERNAVSLGIRCRWGMKHAIFHVAKDSEDSEGKVLGVACWLRPSDPFAPRTWGEYLGSWWLWLEQVRMNLWYGRGGLNVRRYYIWKSAQSKAQEELWTDRQGYYFCNIVTVLPEVQGRGVGKLLFKHVTDVADKEGRGCYLESSKAEPNMAIYERLGFTLKKKMRCDDDGNVISLYCMMREPRG